ncbi:potassium transporter TrkG [Breoghania sp. L-A4]|uniref:TrkH family potassium uptake protein n=1 Tax=Breoghania sp. L-A4 TaxID=2304600 RepID=UPI000E35B432|nr:potassium transporter TrkG [Breoghania sp. L-A4]AXS40660.1 TrkH family potassium uptake protein [Breoghania sp. L-A4]
MSGFCALSFLFALNGRRSAFGRMQSFLLLTLCWVVLGLIGALPFAITAGLSPADSVFESVSGLTTTGATVFTNLADYPLAIIFWRAELQWLGGLLTLLSITLISAPAGIGGLPDRHIRLAESAEGMMGHRVVNAVRDIAGLYLLTTVACMICLLLSGIPPIDALCLALATVSTGGFVPIDGNISDYGNPFAEIAMIIFMLLGASSILWQRMLLTNRRQLLARHRESYSVMALAGIVGLMYALTLFRAAGSVDVLSPLTALREGLFTAASLVSTTGFEVRHGGFAVLPLTLVMFIALVGGGTFSTAGGLKHYRLGGMLVQAYRELGRLVYPHGIRSAQFGSQVYDIQLMKAIWSFFSASIVVVAFGSLALALEDIDYEGALVASIAAFSNIGPLYPNGWLAVGAEAWPAYAALNGPSKMILCTIMILGRIEVLALFAAANHTYWLRR